MKIENQSLKWSHKLDRIRLERIAEFVSISSDSVYESVVYDPVKNRLSELEAETEEPTNHKAKKQTL